MPKLKITGVPPYDGEYEFPESLNNDDYHLIKEISRVRAGELEEALKAGDIDVLVALVVIALQRQGVEVDRRVLGRAQPDAFDVEDDADAVPPPPMSAEPERKQSGPTSSSGVPGNITGGHPENDPNHIGDLGLAIGAISDPVTSEG